MNIMFMLVKSFVIVLVIVKLWVCCQRSALFLDLLLGFSAVKEIPINANDLAPLVLYFIQTNHVTNSI